MSASKQNPWLFVPRNITAIALIGCAAAEFRKMEKEYEDIERKEDVLRVLKDTQAEEQLQYLESAAERKRTNEEADSNIERQLKRLGQTAPLLSDVLGVTGQRGPIIRMALGMIENGSTIGEAILATSEAEMQMEQMKAAQAIALQQRQVEVVQYQQQAVGQAVAVVAPPEIKSDIASEILRAAAIAGIKTQCIQTDVAPSYKRLVFKVRTEDFASLTKWESATKLALGEKNKLPMYVHGPELVAVEVSLKSEERKFYDFPKRDWIEGGRLIVLGQSLEGEVVIDLANEDTPQLLIVGTTGSGKSNFLRSAAYCLLMQEARVDICGGKISDYEDFPARFPNIRMSDMGRTHEIIQEYYQECDRRNSMSKSQLLEQQPWVAMIDEYKGTVPLDDKERKTYDGQTCEVGRRGRGLGLHLLIGLQRGSKRNKEDPQGLPVDLRGNLPGRIAFRCTEALDGRLVLHRRGEVVTSLLGRGDGIVQSGLIDTRFQSYRFDKIPD
ncbi:MAG TPA: FtsK/SpoIIIE domain-containing protein [Nodularia sp. (in: cyanobacteria)]|nr:FtsK/SpoIIIE domain-containing protein [Nodularia sp. (in: cyanobacteria)]